MNRMQNKGWRRAGVSLLVLLATGMARATLLVQEGFDYPPSVPINGTQTGGVGFAALSSWGSANANITTGLKFTGLANAGSNAFQVIASTRIARSVASSFGGSTFYVSMVINNYGVNDPRFGVELRNGDGPCLGRVNGGWGFFAGYNGALGIVNSTGDYKTWVGVPAPADSVPHLIVFKFDYAANAIKLYVDPLPAIGEPIPSATLTTGGDWTINLDSDVWTGISFYRQGGANETIDEVRIGTTWADVAPVNPIATTTDAWWTNVTASAGSSWGDANNWVNSAGANVLPGPGHANLTVGGPTYTALYDGSYPAISNLNVANVAPNTAKLLISGPLTSLGGAAIRLLSGSSVTVTNGGVWDYVGINGVTDQAESMLSIRNGGELNIAGGLFAFTNLPFATSTYGNSINVGYQSTGTLRVTSGSFQYYERAPRATTNWNRFLKIGSGVGGVGFMELSGGEVVLGRIDGGAETLSVGCGSGSAPYTLGSVTVSGGGLYFTNSAAGSWNALRIGFNYGVGILTVTNNGLVRLNVGGLGARLTIGQAPYGTGILRMNGGLIILHEGMTAGNNTGYGGTVWTTGIVEVTAGNFETGSGASVGYAESASGGGMGAGFINIYGGAIHENYWGYFIGRSRAGGVAYGRMNMTGGVLNVWGAAAIMDGNRVANSGFAVGCIGDNEANAGTRAWGDVLFSGGTITNAGVTVIGVNGGTGVVRQVGGTFRCTGAADKFTIIGYACGFTNTYAQAVGGGVGSYELAGGSYYTPNRAFIGGVPTNIQYFARGGNTGQLKVNGGSFTSASTLMVGGYGVGTLTIGSNGTCSVQHLTLTNNTQSTLRCELGANGLGTLTASGTLNIYPGAKLEVDTTAYTGGEARIKLVDCVTRNGSFDPANITVTGKGYVRQDEADIYLQFPRGTMLMVR